MNGQYKVAGFDVAAIRTLVGSLQEAGLPVAVVWRKNNKDVDQPEDANSVRLDIGETWVLRQLQRRGTVRPDHMSAEQSRVFLRCLKAHGFYSEPNWGLGTGMLVLYWLILLLVVITQSPMMPWIAPVLICGGVAVTVLLWVLYHSTLRPLNRAFWWAVMIAGGLGYLVTTLYSLLALPMASAIMVNSLYHRIRNVDAGPAGDRPE